MYVVLVKSDRRWNLFECSDIRAPDPGNEGDVIGCDRGLERERSVNMTHLRQWLRRRLSPGTWNGWPEKAYQQDRYRQRLAAVQNHLTECLDLAPGGPVRIISVCAGDGRDAISVLSSHQRRHDVSAWLIEQDRQSVLDGMGRAARVGLANTVTFLNDDATDYATYQRIVPADIVLLCGVWGHVPASERVLLVRALTTLCKARGMVIWTRGISKGLERLHEIQAMFATSSWEQSRVSFTSDKKWAVVIHRYLGLPNELPSSGRLFHFRTGAGTG